jgi:hypothetical protein
MHCAAVFSYLQNEKSAKNAMQLFKSINYLFLSPLNPWVSLTAQRNKQE